MIYDSPEHWGKTGDSADTFTGFPGKKPRPDIGEARFAEMPAEGILSLYTLLGDMGAEEDVGLCGGRRPAPYLLWFYPGLYVAKDILCDVEYSCIRPRGRQY